MRVGRIELDGETTLGALTFDLTLTAGDITTTNHYARWSLSNLFRSAVAATERHQGLLRLSVLRFLNLAFR